MDTLAWMTVNIANGVRAKHAMRKADILKKAPPKGGLTRKEKRKARSDKAHLREVFGLEEAA